MTESSLAGRLVAAFGSGAVVVPAEEDLPMDMDAAERIEDAVAATLGPIGAFKLGATIPAVRATLGLPRAVFGPVPSVRVFADGADIPASVARQRGIECEYGFRLGRDLREADLADEAVLMGAFDAVHPAIEIPGTRFERLAAHGGLGLVADGGAVGAFVLGPAVALGALDLSRLVDAPVTLDVSGEPAIEGSGAVIDGGPCGPLLDFARSAHARGYTLRRGHVVATGTCTGYVLVEPGRMVSARFEALGAGVTMRFAPLPPTGV